MSDTTQQISDEDFFDEMTADELGKMRVRMATLESAVQLALRENEATRCGLREDVCRALIESLASSAEPSPALPAERVIEVAPQGEIPDDLAKSLAGPGTHITITHADSSEGQRIVGGWKDEQVRAFAASWIARAEARLRLADDAIAALTAAREELAAMTRDRDLWQQEHDGDCPNKAALDAMVEERDRAQAALRETRKIFDRQSRAICGNDQLSGCEEFYRGYNAIVRQENAAGNQGLQIIDAALKPVSDRQPEGETK